jgi:hypothetical protein
MAADNQQQDTSQFTRIYSLAIPPGIKRDGTVFQAEEFTDGVWCRFQRGDAKKIGGYRSLFQSLSGAYRGLFAQPSGGINYIFAGNYNELDIFTTGTTYGAGSGPYKANMLLGTTYANILSNTTTTFTVKGNVTTVFPATTQVLFAQSTSPTIYTVSTAVYGGTNTVVTFSPAVSGTVTKAWVANAIFTPDPKAGPYRLLWQFDANFSPMGGNLQVITHPGYNLENIDSGVASQVLVGNVTPTIADQWNFTGLSDSEGQNPTYKTISVDGGVCVLYPFIFAYGSNGFISNNNVDLTLANYSTQNFYDWNGALANQVNVAASKIVKGMTVRGGTNSPSGLFWATDSLVRVSFTGQAPLYWRYDIVSSQISIMSSSSIVEMDGTYFWMGVDRFYQYNGNVSVLPNDKNVNWLFDNLNYQQRQKVWATKIPRYNEIWFFYPRGTATECTDAIIYNVKDKLWYDAGQAIGAQRSCGYTTEIFPTPIWADWNYDPIIDSPVKIIANPASLPAPGINQFYVSGNLTPTFSPGSSVTFTPTDSYQATYTVTSSLFTVNTTIGTPGVTLVTCNTTFVPGVSAGTNVYPIAGGFNIWQHEFGVNKIDHNSEIAIYSSITTSDISWLTGNPSQEANQGINRRMHLRRVEPNFLQTGTMGLTILGRKFAGGQYEENSGPYYFTQDTGKIDLRVEHRLVRLKFVSNEVNGNFEMGRNLITAEFGDERP